METAVSSNPLLASDRKNKLQLGVFAFNGTGVSFTQHADQRQRTWQDNVEIAQRADKMGLEALVSFARWLPLVEAGNPSGRILDPIAWSAALGAVTENIAVITTVHTFALSPVSVAKAIATVDHISDGRSGVNIVVGWNEPEAALFGKALNPHDDRYVLSQEWLDIVEKSWSEEKHFDYDGEYFQLTRAISDPRPVAGRPVIMNAGSSDRGRDFAAANADMAFITIDKPEHDAVKAQVDGYRQLAREKYGREIQVWVHSYVVQRDSREAAEAYVNEYAIEQGDLAAAEEFITGAMGIDLQKVPAPVVDGLRFRVNAGAFGLPLLGTAEDIAGTLQMVSDAGVDGVLLTWLDYNKGLAEFEESVMPALVSRGLRSGSQ